MSDGPYSYDGGAQPAYAALQRQRTVAGGPYSYEEQQQDREAEEARRRYEELMRSLEQRLAQSSRGKSSGITSLFGGGNSYDTSGGDLTGMAGGSY